MFPVQLPELTSDEVSRCEERVRLPDAGKSASRLERSDAALRGSVERALWKDEVLRAIEYYEVDVHVRNGVVYLNGHVASFTSQRRIEGAIRSVPGVQAVHNHLILDDKLTMQVAGALGILEHTYDCKFFTGSSHGVISISGTVSSEHVKRLAERCAAENPNVRAVISHVRVSGALEVATQDLPFLQPVIGETIYFLDGLSGVVERVIIDPHNRRVVAMTLRTSTTDPRLSTNLSSRLPAQLVNVPMDAIRYLTRGSGFLLINSTERDRYQDFDAASFTRPGTNWTPPYPYCRQDVLFPAPVEPKVLEPIPFETGLEVDPLEEQAVAN